MANPYAGQVAITVDGQRHLAKLTLGALAVMEAGMLALGIPHGPGALANAAQVVAEG